MTGLNDYGDNMHVAAGPIAIGRWTRIRQYARTHLRYETILILFVVMTINQADRATLSIASVPMSGELSLSHVQIGWMLSAFAWAYMLFQLPGGWAIDRFGSIPTLGRTIFLWSLLAGLVGTVTVFGTAAAVPLVFVLIFLVGAAAAPSFPSNSKIVAMWFPTQERATATALFNSSQYVAAALFTAPLAAIGQIWGWRAIFFTMAALGCCAGLLFVFRVKPPWKNAKVTTEEMSVLRNGGALLNPHGAANSHVVVGQPRHHAFIYARKLLTHRMYFGIYTGQYCISMMTFFFLTWFPLYLVQQRHASLLQAGLMASAPAMFGFVGGLSGGALSDFLLRRGATLSVARKTPLCLGMLMSMSIIICNYVHSDTLIVALMAVAFFGKALGAVGWAIIADVAPPGYAGLNASIFNTFGSAAGITTPIAIGYIVQTTHSFNAALVFVGIHALLAIVCFVVIAGPLRRVENL